MEIRADIKKFVIGVLRSPVVFLGAIGMIVISALLVSLPLSVLGLMKFGPLLPGVLSVLVWLVLMREYFRQLAWRGRYVMAICVLPFLFLLPKPTCACGDDPAQDVQVQDKPLKKANPLETLATAASAKKMALAPVDALRGRHNP
jgi:hypothetical protein